MKNIFRNRLFKHFLYFIFLIVLIHGFNYFFRSAHKDFLRTVVIAFGITLGMFLFSRNK